MCFEEENQPVTNAALLKEVASCREATSLFGSAFSTVFTQCCSPHIGTDSLQQDQMFKVTALTSDRCPFPEGKIQCSIDRCFWRVNAVPFANDGGGLI